MSIFEALAPVQPTADQGATRIKRTLALSFHQIENSLSVVRQIIERHGRSEIDTALGRDQADVERLYQALKTLVEKNKPGSMIPEMPTESKNRES